LSVLLIEIEHRCPCPGDEQQVEAPEIVEYPVCRGVLDWVVLSGLGRERLDDFGAPYRRQSDPLRPPRGRRRRHQPMPTIFVTGLLLVCPHGVSPTPPLRATPVPS